MSISAPRIYTENNEMEPDAVPTVTTQIPAGSTFEIIFPHTSVMVVRLVRKSDNGL
jgi:hypothetical protein